MAFKKKFFAVILCLVLLAIPLSVGAAAEGDPYAPIITKQPLNGVDGLFIQAGDQFQLSIEAKLPEIGGVLSYAWYDYDWRPGDTKPPVAVGANVNIQTTLEMLSDINKAAGKGISYVPDCTYCAVVTNTYTDADGKEQTAYIKSNAITITLYASIKAAVSDFWNYKDKEFGVLLAVVMAPYNLGMTIYYVCMVIGFKSINGMTGLLLKYS